MIRASLICLLLALICGTAFAGPVVGGTGNEKPADEEVMKVVANIHQSVEAKTVRQFEKIEPISYKVQYVAGKNYFIKAVGHGANNEGKSYLHLRVYKPFRGAMELTSVKMVPSQTEPLEYFD